MKSSSLVVEGGDGVYAAGERFYLLSSRLTPRDGTAKGVLFAHGSGGTFHTALGIPAIPEVARSGFVVLSGDLGGGVTYANNATMTRMDEAVAYLRSGNRASTGKLSLIGSSMGAANVLGWARTHISEVERIALLIPVVDVEDVRANNRGAEQAGIEAAWGGNAAWQAARPTRNPIEYAAALAGIPIKCWYATDDSIVMPSRVQAFADASGAKLSSMGAVGHSAAAVPFGEVAEFLVSGK
jgi:pimeloyl-ACP methyl ester carboxylesterase